MMNNPLTLTIFGATGDLYKNKLSSALFGLFSSGLLPENFDIVGFARRPMTDLEFQNFTNEAILAKNKSGNIKNLRKFLSHLKYVQGDLKNPESFKNLSEKLAQSDEKKEFCANKLFYLAVPPALYGNIFKNISEAGLTVPCAPSVLGRKAAWTRVLVEKPFGKDKKEAERLDKMLGELFDESQIFRIDHYLAKETMRNLLAFRFQNGVFESLWNNKNIERIRIVFHEKEALSERGAFYDGVGALLDVGQNHMLQMLAIIAMENPHSEKAEKIQDARRAVLQKTIILNKGKNKILRGQYDGYTKENNVKSDSKTETFFRVELGIDNPRWRGVLFEMESGKALSESDVYIEVCFKKLNSCLKFPISLNKKNLSDAYGKVLYDCISGDRTIFVSTEEIMFEWKLVTNIIKLWQKIPLVSYPKGSLAENIK